MATSRVWRRCAVLVAAAAMLANTLATPPRSATHRAGRLCRAFAVAIASVALLSPSLAFAPAALADDNIQSFQCDSGPWGWNGSWPDGCRNAAGVVAAIHYVNGDRYKMTVRFVAGHAIAGGPPETTLWVKSAQNSWAATYCVVTMDLFTEVIDFDRLVHVYGRCDGHDQPALEVRQLALEQRLRVDLCPDRGP